MFTDAWAVESGSRIDTQVCIVGGGVAGLSMSRRLAESGIASCVIESGGFRPDQQTRDLHRGQSVGIDYQFADGCRSRFLGGSSNCWGGFCRAFSAHDFERRDWVADSGWPFGLQELKPFYDQAREALQLGPDEFGTEYWTHAIARADVRRLPLTTGQLADAVSQFSKAICMGDQLRRGLEKSSLIRIILRGNVTDISVGDNCTEVTHVTVRSLSGRQFTVGAKYFVLATGGIENPRLLLAANRQVQQGLGNGEDLVGRYFMEHARMHSGCVQFNNNWSFNRLYDLKFQYRQKKVSANGVKVAAQLFPTAGVQADQRLLNSQIWFDSIMPGENSESAEAFRRMKHRLDGKAKVGYEFSKDLMMMAAHPRDWISYAIAFKLNVKSMVKGVRMQCVVEPEPNPASRVTLSRTDADALGMPRVNVDWRLTENVTRTFNTSFQLVKQELEAAGIAKVVLDPELRFGDWSQSFEREGTWHHMGTTRMHASPKKGVVDSDCRVHGMSNLYVAGSSVFPTASSNFPTFTLVALALRLCRHLSARLAGAH